MFQAGLVLEGGGLKGVYTSGVLDFFLDKGIEFASCYGVSAGACSLCSFLSKQRGRAYHVNVDYLDGGISDAIPLRRSMKDGNRKNVVVMTKEIGYRRKQSSMVPLIKLRYKKYPKVYELMKNRHIVYNDTLDFIEEQVKAGNTFLIWPREKSDVGRIEKNKVKLQALYEEGYREVSECYEDLLRFLEE